jgi:hypothetical protein
VRSVGRTGAGQTVLARVAGGSAPVRVTFSTDNGGVVAGRAMTLIAVVLLLILSGILLTPRIRRA